MSFRALSWYVNPLSRRAAKYSTINTKTWTADCVSSQIGKTSDSKIVNFLLVYNLEVSCELLTVYNLLEVVYTTGNLLYNKRFRSTY